MSRWEPDDLDALCEIVDALANHLDRQQWPSNLALQTIAQRSRKLRQKTLGETDNGTTDDNRR
jgi:hypothetical protein